MTDKELNPGTESELKDLIPLRILYILSKYTNENNRILASTTSKDVKLRKTADGANILPYTVEDYLRTEFNIRMDRKAISRHLKELVDCGGDLGHTVECDRKTRIVKGEEQEIYTNFYYDSSFDNSELRFLIDSVLFSKHIPQAFAKDIVKKLRKLGGGRFYRAMSSVVPLLGDTYHTDNKVLLNNIDVIGDAISNMYRISFTYNEYRFNDEKHCAELAPVNDRPNPVTVSPYQMLIDHEIYYLLAKAEGEEGITHFRVDLMSNIQQASGKYVDKNTTDLGMQGVQQYLSSHTFMSEGSSTKVTLRVSEHLLGYVLRDFGNKARIERDKEAPDSLIVNVQSARNDILQWALIHSDGAEITYPEDLRYSIERLTANLSSRYHSSEKDRYYKAIQEIHDDNGKSVLLTNLDLTTETSYKQFTNARTVIVNNCKGFDYEALKNFKSCTWLHIENNVIPSLDFITEMPKLKQLSINGCEIERFTLNFMDNPALQVLEADTRTFGVKYFYYPLGFKHLTINNNTDDYLDYEAIKLVNTGSNVNFMVDDFYYDYKYLLSHRTNKPGVSTEHGVYIVK